MQRKTFDDAWKFLFSESGVYPIIKSYIKLIDIDCINTDELGF